jgi:bla regulator protein BlaR1
MTVLVNIALINAFTVVPLALLVWLIGRLVKRPALTHALWVLVLVKFVTLPLVILPLTIELPTTEQPIAVEAESISKDTESIHGTLTLTTRHATDFERIAPALTPGSMPPGPSLHVSSEVATKDRAGRTAVAFTDRLSHTISILWRNRPGLQSMLLTCWFGGVVGWIGLQVARAIRFQRRVLRDAVEVDELREQTQRIALKMGLRTSPQVRIINAFVSPMLWGCGSWTVLLFPADLAERLDDESRATLLAHELAHYSRGDHVVRLLELIVIGLFWWHPVAWWARQQIEEAEEECCDAWVIGEFPHAPRRYAEALLDTIDFLCEAPADLPPIASGLGQSHFLRHRLTKIVRGVAPKSMSVQNRWVLALVAALMLPLHPFALGSSSLRDARFNSAQRNADEFSESKPARASESEVADSADDSTLPSDQPAEKDVPRDLPVPKSEVPRRRGEQAWANAVSPDGRFVVRTTTARRVVLSDLTKSSETDLSDERIVAVAFSPDGDWFASASLDGVVAIWDSARATKLRTLLTHSEALRTVAVSPRGDAIASGSRDGTVLFNDSMTGRSLIEVPRYSTAVNCVRFSSNGDQLAIAAGDWQSNHSGQVSLLDLETGKVTTSLRCTTSPGALAYASNEELIVGHWDGRTQLWNLTTRKVIGTAMANKSIVAAAAFSPDSPVLREVTFGFVDQAPQANDSSPPISFLRSMFERSSSSVE